MEYITMKGVTLITYRRFFGSSKTKEDLRQISHNQLAHIYKTGYWDSCKCDDLPPGVDLSVFDGAVNSGPARSARWLQCAVGAGQDGVIGPKTLMKAEAMQPVSIIHEICNTRLAFLKSLGNWTVFGRGWGKRVELIRADAIHLALGSDPDTGLSQNSELFEIIRKDSRGEWVRKLQKALKIEVDGMFGNKTQDALVTWQKQNSLEPDGIAGRNTYRALGLIA